MRKYQIIYADPPWEYSRPQYENVGNNHAKQKGATRGAKHFYNLMNEDDIAKLKVNVIADTDCLLFLWATGPKMQEALSVGKAWGFSYVTVAFVWHKKRVNPGNYTMSVCEYILVFKKGKIPSSRGRRNIEQFYLEMRTLHSKKPNEFRTRIKLMFPKQRAIELFAREKVGGWDSWGNEVESDISL